MALSSVVSANRYGVSRVDRSSRWGLGCGDVRRNRRRRRRWWQRGWRSNGGGKEGTSGRGIARVSAEPGGGCKEVDSALDQGPLSLAGREGRRRRDEARVDVEGCSAGVALAEP